MQGGMNVVSLLIQMHGGRSRAVRCGACVGVRGKGTRTQPRWRGRQCGWRAGRSVERVGGGVGRSGAVGRHRQAESVSRALRRLRWAHGLCAGLGGWLTPSWGRASWGRASWRRASWQRAARGQQAGRQGWCERGWRAGEGKTPLGGGLQGLEGRAASMGSGGGPLAFLAAGFLGAAFLAGVAFLATVCGGRAAQERVSTGRAGKHACQHRRLRCMAPPDWRRWLLYGTAKAARRRCCSPGQAGSPPSWAPPSWWWWSSSPAAGSGEARVHEVSCGGCDEVGWRDARWRRPGGHKPLPRPKLAHSPSSLLRAILARASPPASRLAGERALGVAALGLAAALGLGAALGLAAGFLALGAAGFLAGLFLGAAACVGGTGGRAGGLSRGWCSRWTPSAGRRFKIPRDQGRLPFSAPANVLMPPASTRGGRQPQRRAPQHSLLTWCWRPAAACHGLQWPLRPRCLLAGWRKQQRRACCTGCRGARCLQANAAGSSCRRGLTLGAMSVLWVCVGWAREQQAGSGGGAVGARHKCSFQTNCQHSTPAGSALGATWSPRRSHQRSRAACGR